MSQVDINERNLIEKYSLMAEKNNHFDLELYNKYNVKRGLRNADSTGVLVGLTKIGDVHSYVMENNKKIPVEGVLYYRGINLYDFVLGFQEEKRYGFEECCYLLLFGELPNKQELRQFKDLLRERRFLPAGFTRDMILKAPSRNIMNKLARSVLVSYSYDDNPEDASVENIIRQSLELIAKFPILAAYGYQAYSHYYQGNSLHIHNPRHDYDTAENLLHLIRPDGEFTRSEAEILDLALVLHAEHGGGNNSSFVTHVVSSTGTDTYSVIASAIGSLKGSKHGGANLKVMEMMEDIKANVKDWEDEKEITNYLCKILNKEAFDGSGLIYGIGHAVYTLSDPRAMLLKQKASELAKEKGMQKEYNLYKLVEKLAPNAFYDMKKSDKVLCANVDFYSGFVYKMLNIPVELYTSIFGVARIPGWCAHLIEEKMVGGKIIRPAYKNVADEYNYIPLAER
jgi:citrate synthase